MPSASLLIDDREPSYLQDAVLAAVPGAEVRRLTMGDYLIEDQCGHLLAVERKDISDLLHSMSDGRLRQQIPNLDNFDHGMLLIEGCWEITPKGKVATPIRGGKSRVSGFSASSVQMALLGHQRNFPNLVVLHTSSIPETVEVLRSLARRAGVGCVMDGAKKKAS